MVWSQMKIPSFSQMSLRKSFYYELRARGKKGTENRNVGNALIKSRILLIHLQHQLLDFKDFCCYYVCLKCYRSPLIPSISPNWTDIDPEFPVVMWRSFRIKWSRVKKCAVVFVTSNCIHVCEPGRAAPESTIFLRPSRWNLRAPFVFPVLWPSWC